MSMFTNMTLVILRAPFYAAYACYRLFVGLLSLPRRLIVARRLLAKSLPCGSCHHQNRLDGRWSCSYCGAIYHGFVGECGLCGAGASFFPCESCGIAIPLRGRS